MKEQLQFWLIYAEFKTKICWTIFTWQWSHTKSLFNVYVSMALQSAFLIQNDTETVLLFHDVTAMFTYWMPDRSSPTLSCCFQNSLPTRSVQQKLPWLEIWLQRELQHEISVNKSISTVCSQLHQHLYSLLVLLT